MGAAGWPASFQGCCRNGLDKSWCTVVGMDAGCCEMIETGVSSTEYGGDAKYNSSGGDR
jgi:hypothetical protein